MKKVVKNEFRAIEVLESRTLMSLTPFDPTVTADRLEVKADLLKFRADNAAGELKMLTDLAALKGDHLPAATTVFPLVKTFRADLKTMGKQLYADRLAESAAALSDESVIVRELRQILIDSKNPTAKAADETALTTDRVKLQTDLIAGLNSRIATREAAETTITNDVSAINTAAQTDPNASAKLKTDLGALLADREAKISTLTGDLQTLVADRIKLSGDLAAE